MPAPPLVLPPACEPLQRRQDLVAPVARRRRQHQSGGAGVDHDRHPVLRAQLRDQGRERLLEQRQLVGLVHRTGGVDQEHQVGRRQLGLRHIKALDPDHQQLSLRIPRRGGEFGRRAERRRQRGRRRMAVIEVVDELFGAHRVRRRPHALAQHPAHVGVAAGVDVDGEGGNRLLSGAVDRIVGALGVFLGVAGLPVVVGLRRRHCRRWRRNHRELHRRRIGGELPGFLPRRFAHACAGDLDAVEAGFVVCFRRLGLRDRCGWRRRGRGCRCLLCASDGLRARRGLGGRVALAGGQGQRGEQCGGECVALHGAAPSVVVARGNARCVEAGLGGGPVVDMKSRALSLLRFAKLSRASRPRPTRAARGRSVMHEPVARQRMPSPHKGRGCLVHPLPLGRGWPRSGRERGGSRPGRRRRTRDVPILRLELETQLRVVVAAVDAERQRLPAVEETELRERRAGDRIPWSGEVSNCRRQW